MDLSGHHRFRARPAGIDRPGDHGADSLGEALLATAWAALVSARAEAVDIHLKTGHVIADVRAVRLIGRLAETAAAPDCWTHAFDVEAVALVELVPRGGRR